jgi:GNAT superfamily N-acetyltransferase
MSSTLHNMLCTYWKPFLARTCQLRRRPLLVILRSLLQRIPFRPLDINCLYFLEYDGIPPPHVHLLRGRAEVRRATLQDLEALTRCQDKRLAFLNRFKSNDHCVVAVLDGQVVGYEWFCDKPVYVEERYLYTIDVPPDAIYAYDVFILPEHRLTGIWLKFKSLYLRDLMQTLQRQRVIGTVDYANRISMNTLLRFGFRLFGVLFVFKVFGKAVFLRRNLRGAQVALPRSAYFADHAGAHPSTSPESSRALAATAAVLAKPAVASPHVTIAPSPKPQGVVPAGRSVLLRH